MNYGSVLNQCIPFTSTPVYMFSKFAHISLYLNEKFQAFRCQRHYVCRLSVLASFHRSFRPSVCPTVRPSDRPLPKWPTFFPSARPPVPRGFRAFVLECMGGMVWKFGMLTNPVHLQNWLDFGHGLLIFLILVPLRLNETGKFKLSGHFLQKAWEEWPEIWHTDVSLPRRWTGRMVWNLTCCFSVITFRTDYISVTVCWFSSCWCHFDLVKLVIFEVSGYFHESTWE